MRCPLLIGLICFALAALPCAGQDEPAPLDMTAFNQPLEVPKPQVRERVCLNGLWELTPLPELFTNPIPATAPTNYASALFRYPGNDVPLTAPVPGEAAKWDPIRVPGMWRWPPGATPEMLESPAEWADAHCVWYRRAFDIPQHWRGKRVTLQFGAVACFARVYVNGTEVGGHLGAVGPFELDITEVARFGQPNELLVYVVDVMATYTQLAPTGGGSDLGRMQADSLPVTAAYYVPAGIWQDVYLQATDVVFIEDVYVRTSVAQSRLEASVSLRSMDDEQRALVLSGEVLDSDGDVEHAIDPRTLTIGPGQVTQVELSDYFPKAKLWGIGEPNLYYLKLALRPPGQEQVLDDMVVCFGFREVSIKDRDIYLNGKKLQVRGDTLLHCFNGQNLIHQRPEYCKLAIEALQEMNFVCPRVAALWTNGAILDAADELGFPVIAAGIDGYWEPGDKLDNWLGELGEWIRRDRNHPSLLLWSLANEGSLPRDDCIVLAEVVERLDPSRPFMFDGWRDPDRPSPPAGKISRDWSYEVEAVRAGSLYGYAPIANAHNLTRNSSLTRAIEWARLSHQRWAFPVIMGEIAVSEPQVNIPGRSEDILGDTAWATSADERYRAYGRQMRLLLEGWRTYGLSGMCLDGLYQSIFLPPIPAGHGSLETPLEWGDMATAYPKPQKLYENASTFNPWLTDLPTYRISALGEQIQAAYAPVMLTWSRSLERNYWTGQPVEKTLMVRNDTMADVTGIEVSWELRDGDVVREVDSGFMKLPQGSTTPVRVSFELPTVEEPTTMLLTAKAVRDEQVISEETIPVNIYPAPEIKPPVSRLYLHDPSGETAQILDEAGLEYEPAADLDPQEPSILVIGKDGLMGNDEQPALVDEVAAKFDQFIHAGGVAIVLEQRTQQRLERSLGWVRAAGSPVLADLVPDQPLGFWHDDEGVLFDFVYELPPAYLAKAIVRSGPQAAALMELRSRRGRALLCNLGLTQRYETEPEATLILHSLIEYADSLLTQPPEQPRIAFVGKDEAAQHLTDLPHALQMPAPRAINADVFDDCDLFIIGDNCPDALQIVATEEMRTFVQEGGTLLVLRQEAGELPGEWLGAEVSIQPNDQVPVARLEGKAALADGLGSFAGPEKPWGLEPLPGVDAVLSLKGENWVNILQPCYLSPEPDGHSVSCLPFEGQSLLAAKAVGEGLVVLCQLPIGTGYGPVDAAVNTLFANLELSTGAYGPLMYLLTLPTVSQ